MIPTAEEILELHYNMDKDEDGHPVYYDWSAQDAMIEFAKLHVEAALKEASKKVIVNNYRDEGRIKINKNSILGAYPLENIK